MSQRSSLYVHVFIGLFLTPSLPVLFSRGKNEITGGLANGTGSEKHERRLRVSRRRIVDWRYACIIDQATFSIDEISPSPFLLPISDCQEDVIVKRVIAGNMAVRHPLRIRLVTARARHLMMLFCVTRRRQMIRAIRLSLIEKYGV